MAKPVWFGQLVWSEPVNVGALRPAAIPPGAGLYAFTKDAGEMTPGNVLYIGKADGARQTLRTRLQVYKRRLAAAPGGRKSTHAGLEKLAAYYGSRTGELFLRWAGVVVARDLEGRLIELFDPQFNGKDEHRFGFSDQERIPDDMLYVWP